MSSFGGKNVINVDNARGEYNWQTPVVLDLPYVVDLVETGETVGADGTTFQIKISRREFGHGDIITYDKYNGAEMYITADDIVPLGDGFLYTVQLVNNDSSYGLDTSILSAFFAFNLSLRLCIIVICFFQCYFHCNCS
jgi:hypothetical protein